MQSGPACGGTMPSASWRLLYDVPASTRRRASHLASSRSQAVPLWIFSQPLSERRIFAAHPDILRFAQDDEATILLSHAGPWAPLRRPGRTPAVFRLRLAAHRRRRATLVVHPWPIKFGAPVEAHFRIFMRDGAPVSTLAAKLECVEEVMIGFGRDAQRKRSTRYEAALDCIHQTDRRHLTATWTLVV